MNPHPTYRQLLRNIADRLRRAGVQEPALDARLLIRHAAGLSAEKLLASLSDAAPEGLADDLEPLVKRRENREPLQHITGHAHFFGREFHVDNRVLIPRPETEQLVEQAIGFAQQRGISAPRIVDIGAGSGALAVTLALELPGAEVWATDVSDDALEVARANAEALGASVHFAQGDLFDPLEGRFDVVVSNPPYIRTASLEGLAPELAWEPQGALDGGSDGLAVIRRLFDALPAYLKESESIALVEFDPPVAEESVAVAKSAFPSARVDVLTDLAGFERVLLIELE